MRRDSTRFSESRSEKCVSAVSRIKALVTRLTGTPMSNVGGAFSLSRRLQRALPPSSLALARPWSPRSLLDAVARPDRTEGQRSRGPYCSRELSTPHTDAVAWRICAIARRHLGNPTSCAVARTAARRVELYITAARGRGRARSSRRASNSVMHQQRCTDHALCSLAQSDTWPPKGELRASRKE